MENVPLSTNTQTMINPNKRWSYRFVKRAFDIVASVIGLIVLSPVIIITAIAVFVDDPGPVLFFQERNGLNGKVFKIWKFRSMCKNASELRANMDDQNQLDGPAFKIKDDPRVTKVGRFIRKYSLDELPQLVNVLMGTMSFVGPRPLVTYETERLSECHKQRMMVKPGITCYWQISGRSELSFEEWMELDFKYINEQSVPVDLLILFKTLPAVLSARGGW